MIIGRMSFHGEVDGFTYSLDHVDLCRVVMPACGLCVISEQKTPLPSLSLLSHLSSLCLILSLCVTLPSGLVLSVNRRPPMAPA